jgi:hypothetical protein
MQKYSENSIRKQRLKWAGHIARISGTELVQMMMEELRRGRLDPRRRGGPRKRWTQSVLEDLGEQHIEGLEDLDRIK